MGRQIIQKSTNNFKFRVVRTVIWSKFRIEDPQILVAALKKYVHPWGGDPEFEINTLEFSQFRIRLQIYN
jgi:hypothetical protein